MYWRPKLKKGKMEVLGGGLGKEEILCSELTRKQIGIGAYSEHRWPGKGEFQHGEYCFLFTGASEEDIPNPAHRGGAGIVMNKEITNAWRNSGAQVEFKSTRILGVRFKHKGVKYNVIAVYAPTFMRPEEEHNEFYSDLKQIIKQASRDETLIILGDLNARVGIRDEAWQNELGVHGLEERNENGNRVLDMCTEYGLVVANTWFKHKVYGTWQHVRFKTWHMIDLVLVRRSDINSVRDVKTLCDAECDTDHRLVTAELKITKRYEKRQPEHKRKTGRLTRLDVTKLKEKEVEKQMCDEMHNKIQKIHERKGIRGSYRRTKGGRIHNTDEAGGVEDKILMYTDGSCFENTNCNKDTPAGWGVYVVGGPELYGPVITDENRVQYIGAEIGSNNTGELTAIMESLLWLKEHEHTNKPTIIFSDSEYAIGAALGKIAGKSNTRLIDKLADLTFEIMRKREVYFMWVKGHEGTEGNEKADELAKKGAVGLNCWLGRHAIAQQQQQPTVVGRRLRRKTAMEGMQSINEEQEGEQE